MKRKKDETPGFDEIIFEGRNKDYGAYKIRKDYNSTMGYSLVGGIALAVILVVLPSLSAPKGSNLPGTKITIVAPDANLESMLRVDPEEIQKPVENIPDDSRYLAPEVVSDTSQITTRLKSIEEMFGEIENGNVTEITTELPEDDPFMPPEPDPYIVVQEMPEFPGGQEALLRFISENVRYPVDALENNVEGKIIIRFVVAPTGAVEEARVISSKGTAPDLSILENEALRVVNQLPYWRPGKQDGIPVHVYYTVPVTFSISR